MLRDITGMPSMRAFRSAASRTALPMSIRGLGLSYDLRGTGNTMVRGGWGAYRFVTQVNDVSAPLVTAQHVLGYNLPGQRHVMLSQLSQLGL